MTPIRFFRFTGIFGHRYLRAVAPGHPDLLLRPVADGWIVIDKAKAKPVTVDTVREGVIAGWGLADTDVLEPTAPMWRRAEGVVVREDA